MSSYPTRWHVQRLGVIMAPEGDPLEEEGVLNPGGALGRDGHYYLFPRRVARGNDSTIGRARVCYDVCGLPLGVERECTAISHGPDLQGVEDARVEWIGLLGLYVMAYTTYDGHRASCALAFSRDLLSWTTHPVIWSAEDRDRHGLGEINNKDAIFLPRPVIDPVSKEYSWALLHRPMGAEQGIWISYLPISAFVACAPYGWRHSQPLAMPRPDVAWEALKIGGGVVVPYGNVFLLFYHGVSAERVYSPGLLVLDALMPHRVLDRSAAPLFTPDNPDECYGTVNNVVFPTAYERHGEDVILYYGAADSRICAARLSPESL